MSAELDFASMTEHDVRARLLLARDSLDADDCVAAADWLAEAYVVAQSIRLGERAKAWRMARQLSERLVAKRCQCAALAESVATRSAELSHGSRFDEARELLSAARWLAAQSCSSAACRAVETARDELVFCEQAHSRAA